MPRIFKFHYVMTTGLIHDSRHVGFQIVMQISHVLCWGQTLAKKGKLRKIGSSKYWNNISKSTFYNLQLSPIYHNFISLIVFGILTFTSLAPYFSLKKTSK